MSDIRSVRVAVIGSGFAGIGVARQLLAAGVDNFLVLESRGDIGGSWRDNDYPGCTCDIPSNLYSFSFAPNPRWSSAYSGQAEILAYLTECARQPGIAERIKLDTELRSAAWDDAGQRWLLDTSSGRFSAESVVVAVGPFARPSIPDIPGLDEFAGPVFHSARWDHDTDLTARRVAVIGTGASGVQIIPEVAEKASAVQVYQRTPHWVLPKKNRPAGKLVRTVYERAPVVQRMVRAAQYWSREIPAYAITRRPKLLSLVQRQAEAHLRAQVPDADLRAKLTPGYSVFCKRVLVSSDYYRALTRPHVDLIADGIDRIGPESIVTADGVKRRVDAIVLATGFSVTDPPIAGRLFGLDGRSLARTWQETGRAAYLGTTVAGFPNLFLCTGPNSGTAHTSLLVMIEAQIGYIVDCLRRMNEGGFDVAEIRADVQEAFVEQVQRDMTRTVWAKDGCSSYYFDSSGRNTTLWPGPTWQFRRRTRRFDVESYRLRPRVS